jgi:hypothetical protein
MKHLRLFLALSASLLVFTTCRKDKEPEVVEDPADATTYALVIDNGSQSMEQGKQISLSAHIVSSTGEMIEPASIVWSSNVAGSVSGNSFTYGSEVVATVSAAAVYKDISYTSAIIINVQPVAETRIFAVIPSVIMWPANAGDIQLNTVYLGNENNTFLYSSDDAGIADVSSTGKVSFKNTGTTILKVTGNIGGISKVVKVPVMVTGMPSAPLTVTRITLTPALGELFRGETLQMNAKAFNSNNEDVTSNWTFNYVVVPKQEDDGDPAIPISIDNNGKVTALSAGEAYVQVRAAGFLAQTEIVVHPDSVITVTPFFVTLGNIPPATSTAEIFTATTFKVDRAKYRAHDATFLNQVINSPTLTWDLPLTGNSTIDEQFKLVNILSKTNTTVKVEVIPGKIGSTFIVAHQKSLTGAAGILVNP